MLQEFEKWLRIHKDASNSTRRVYVSNIKKFIEFTDELCQKSVDDYIEHKLDNGLSPRSLNSFLCALKMYCEYKNVSINIPKPKRFDKRNKNYFTEEELNDILKNIPLIFNDYERNDIILRLAFYTGLRNKEIISLKVEDIDFKLNTISVKNTKSKKDRVVPIISKSLISDLNNWIKKINTDILFDISDQQVRQIFQKIKQELDLQKDFTPHIMRHSCAKYLIREGIDVSIVQKILGHSKIETTLIYAEPDTDMVLEAMEKIRR